MIFFLKELPAEIIGEGYPRFKRRWIHGCAFRWFCQGSCHMAHVWTLSGWL